MAMPFNNPNSSHSNGLGLPNETTNNNNTQFLHQLNSNPRLNQVSPIGLMMSSQHPQHGATNTTVGGMSHQHVPQVAGYYVLGRGQLGLSQRVTEIRRRYLATNNYVRAGNIINNNNFPVHFHEEITYLPLCEVIVTEVVTNTQLFSAFPTLDRLLANAVNDEVHILGASFAHALARQLNPNRVMMTNNSFSQNDQPVQYIYHQQQQQQAPPPQHFGSPVNLLNLLSQEPTTTNDPVVTDPNPNYPSPAHRNHVATQNRQVHVEHNTNRNTSNHPLDGTSSRPGTDRGVRGSIQRPGIYLPGVPPEFPHKGSEWEGGDGRTHSLSYNKYGRPYTCPKCMAVFPTALILKVHAFYHHKIECKAERKRRLEARRKSKNLLMAQSADGGVTERTSPRRGTGRKDERESKGVVIKERVASSDAVGDQEFPFRVEINADRFDGPKIKEEMM